MKKSKLLKEVASVKVYKSFRDALSDVSDSMTALHFKTVARLKKQAKRQKDRAAALLSKAQRPGDR